MAIMVSRKLKAADVRRPLRPVHPARYPRPIRSDNGPDFIAKALREWISTVGARTAYIIPGSPWENGYC